MKACQRGFTLIEFVVVISILSILAALGSTLIGQGLRSAMMNVESTALTWQANVALARMSRDLRQIRSASHSDLWPRNNLILLTTVTGDVVRYRLVGETLYRNQRPLADHISVLTFQYYDGAGQRITSLASRTDIRAVHVRLTVSDNHVDYPLATTLRIRNA